MSTGLKKKDEAKDELHQRDIPLPPPDFTGDRPYTGTIHVSNLPVGQRVVEIYLNDEQGKPHIVALPKFLEGLAELQITPAQQQALEQFSPKKTAAYEALAEKGLKAFQRGDLQQAMEQFSNIVIGIFDIRNELNKIKG